MPAHPRLGWSSPFHYFEWFQASHHVLLQSRADYTSSLPVVHPQVSIREAAQTDLPDSNHSLFRYASRPAQPFPRPANPLIANLIFAWSSLIWFADIVDAPPWTIPKVGHLPIDGNICLWPDSFLIFIVMRQLANFRNSHPCQLLKAKWDASGCCNTNLTVKSI